MKGLLLLVCLVFNLTVRTLVYVCIGGLPTVSAI